MCGNPIIKIGNKIYEYKSTVYYLSRVDCRNLRIQSKEYLANLKQNNFDMSIPTNTTVSNSKNLFTINKFEKLILENYSDNGIQHIMHPVIIISLTDIVTGQTITRKHTITSKDKDFNTEPTLTESLLGKTTMTANVIKITDNLYISGHSWISEIALDNEETRDLNFYELNYDASLGYYVGFDSKTGKNIEVKNLTLDALNKANNIIINNLQNNQIQQVDITSMYYPSDDLVAYKLLKSGIYSDLSNIINNKDMVNNLENTLSENYNSDLKEIKSNISNNIEYHENKPKDEL